MMSSRSQPGSEQNFHDSPQAVWHRIAWYEDRFPSTEIKRALEMPEQVVPLIVKTIDEVIANPERFLGGQAFHGASLGFLILAQLREPRGFPLAERFLHLDDEMVDALIGDMLTETFPAILASTFDGTLDSLKRLYENEDLDEFVRIVGLNAMAVLANNGLLPRHELSSYIGDALQRLPREPSYIWDVLVAVASDFRLFEHREAVLALYDEGIADPLADSKEDVATRFDSGPRATLLPRYHLVSDVIKEAAWWSGLREHATIEHPPGAREKLSAFNMPSSSREAESRREPFVRDATKIGRNDPCTCGSGRKFKKCCGS